MKLYGISHIFNIKQQLFPKIKPRESCFVLESKPQYFPISELKTHSDHIPDDAFLYSIVTVGKKNEPDFKKNILTFLDKDKKIIKRIFAEKSQPFKIREYTRNYIAKRNWEDITERRYITTKEFNEKSKKWNVIQDEEQFIQIKTDKYVYKKGFSKKLHINKNKYDYSDNKIKVKSTITEYPLTLGFEDKNVKKILSAELEINKNIPKMTGILPETNVKISEKDEFLPYRLLVGRQKQTSLTQYGLEKRGLGDLGIGIYYSDSEVPQNALGLFDHINGRVVYKKRISRHPIRIAMHEDEHVYQYSLVALLGKLNTPFGIKCREKLPPITDILKMKEGYDYVIASEKYPKLSVTDDLTKNKEYMDNVLEVKSRQKADEIEMQYNKGKKNLHSVFKYALDEACF